MPRKYPIIIPRSPSPYYSFDKYSYEKDSPVDSYYYYVPKISPKNRRRNRRSFTPRRSIFYSPRSLSPMSPMSPMSSVYSLSLSPPRRRRNRRYSR